MSCHTSIVRRPQLGFHCHMTVETDVLSRHLLGWANRERRDCFYYLSLSLELERTKQTRRLQLAPGIAQRPNLTLWEECYF
ncbi:hypothetical protein CEXT_343451 [Caerostris extrusa]|uniref:Uncharacterized protein n=1 Tax=Caerostris extrusa TaxID=172846 RepID=A0AAV4R0Y7_CAEEX|nr:hypothetical protein CEXT_343451 [Caerostris extrusa]